MHTYFSFSFSELQSKNESRKRQTKFGFSMLRGAQYLGFDVTRTAENGDYLSAQNVYYRIISSLINRSKYLIKKGRTTSPQCKINFPP